MEFCSDSQGLANCTKVHPVTMLTFVLCYCLCALSVWMVSVVEFIEGSNGLQCQTAVLEICLAFSDEH